jgi:hypothetical protein
MSVFKKPNKTQKTRFEVGFLGVFFYWAGFLLPTLVITESTFLIHFSHKSLTIIIII